MLRLMTTTYSLCLAARDGNIYAILGIVCDIFNGQYFCRETHYAKPLHKEELLLPFNSRKCHFPSLLKINSEFQLLILIPRGLFSL